MNLVYCPTATQHSSVELDENEHHHLQVLRHQQGEALHIIDGRGHLYGGSLATMDKRTAIVKVAELIKSVSDEQPRLHIAIAPTKNMDRLEWFVEKATEIGISNITPLICQRSERRELRLDRLQKVALSAVKQSLKLFIPQINVPIALPKFLSTQQSLEDTDRYICYCEERGLLLSRAISPQRNITVLIGPEGDFSHDEVNQATSAGYQTVSLGEARLRTETAGIMAAAVFNLFGK